jgi:predicted CXXCH cytochrome family protein
MECYACHQSDYNGADDPNHVQNSFDHDCTQCHSTSVWVPSTFNHSNTQFPLTGRHLELQCNECHDAGYQIPFDCWSCHEADYHGAEDHDANNFPHDCTQCHNTNDWGEGGFNHNNTLFPLTGAHLTIQCIDCHAGGYQDIPTACYSCHDQDYSGVDDPDHVIDNFSQDCTQCHTTTAWLPANYDHNLSQFPLTGAHVGVPCASCHATGFDNTAMECFGCHQDDFNSVPDPNHVVNGFDHVCTQCHTTAGWTPATYDHSGTQFPLTGAHTSLPCASCHANGFDNTPFECYACHQADYDGVVEPSHTQNNFDHDCTQCHGTNAWLPSTFNHGQTQFPLTGAHMSVPCISCHAGGYENTPMDCYSCHQTDYENVPDPDHELNNFSHICIECHNTNAWLPTTFNHNQTLFPLTGAHTVLPCISCHADGYDNMPLECYACHQPDFEGVADPNHVANDYDHLCTQCHTTAAWSPATYDHNLTQFPLTGAHISAPCASCHANGFENTPMECFACHQSDYNNTDPSHQAMGFPTTCQDCHNTNAWDPSTWFHDAQYFPIFSGRHEGEWSACGDCHVNPNDFTVFECIFCHEHNQPDTDDRHTEVIGYQYNSQACYNCHPTGDGGGRRGK